MKLLYTLNYFYFDNCKSFIIVYLWLLMVVLFNYYAVMSQGVESK